MNSRKDQDTAKQLLPADQDGTALSDMEEFDRELANEFLFSLREISIPEPFYLCRNGRLSPARACGHSCRMN